MKSTKRTPPPTDTPKESIEKEKPQKSKNEEFEDAIMVAYQKKEPGEWEKVEIPYRRKIKR